MADVKEPETTGAQIPDDPTLDRLREAAAECTACPLYRNATQTVFGEGPERAAVMFVGEQPGDTSSLLRAPDEEAGRRETIRFIEDLKTIAEVLGSS